jgi:hypothetical protein
MFSGQVIAVSDTLFAVFHLPLKGIGKKGSVGPSQLVLKLSRTLRCRPFLTSLWDREKVPGAISGQWGSWRNIFVPLPPFKVMDLGGSVECKAFLMQLC